MNGCVAAAQVEIYRSMASRGVFAACSNSFEFIYLYNMIGKMCFWYLNSVLYGVLIQGFSNILNLTMKTWPSPTPGANNCQ